MPVRLRSTPRPGHNGIVEFAEALGVSPSTVSRALRPETAHLVRADLRKQILDLAEREHFLPNLGARIMRKGVNTSLSVIVPLDENIFFSEFYGRFLSGILHAASLRGWGVQMSTLSRKPGDNLRETMQHLGLQSSGIIYLGEPLSDEDLDRLKGYGRPLVLTKSALPPEANVQELGIPVVGVDNAAGAHSAMSLLLQLGHRDIGLILGPSSSRDAFERRQGYLAALKAAGVLARENWIFEGPFATETGRDGMELFLKQDRRPTAICCASDEIAFGAIQNAQTAGMQCPSDLSVVGFDDGPWAAACRPTLTTVRQPLSALAERAVGLLVESASKMSRNKWPIIKDMPAAMVIRDSSQPLHAPRR